MVHVLALFANNASNNQVLVVKQKQVHAIHVYVHVYMYMLV